MNEIVLSYHDALIRKEDYMILLSPSEWITDSLIEFWFEYLSKRRFQKYSSNTCFVSPSVTQFIKLTDNKEEYASIINSLQIDSGYYIFLPINNNQMLDDVGGTHWSLLVFNIRSKVFEYHDSMSTSQTQIEAIQNLILKFMSVLTPNVSPLDSKCLLMSELIVVDCLRQADSSSCGVHLMCNADAAARRLLTKEHLNITAPMINNYRAVIVEAIDSIKKEQEEREKLNQIECSKETSLAND